MHIAEVPAYIKSSGNSYARIEDTSGAKINVFTGCKDSSELAGRFTDWMKYAPTGDFRIVFKPRSLSAGKDECIIYVTNTEAKPEGAQTIQAVKTEPTASLHELTAKLRAEVRDEIRAEMEAHARQQALINEIEDLKRENRELKNPIDKLGAVLTAVIENSSFVRGLGFAPATLQGTPEQRETTTPDISDTDWDKVDQAEELLLKHFTPDEFLQMAKKIDSNPSSIKTIKGFLL